MTCMAEEQDSILCIHAKVDSHDEMIESITETSQANTTTPTAECPWVVFCARQKQLCVTQILPRVASMTENSFTGQVFVKGLVHLLRGFTEVSMGYQDVSESVVRSFQGK